MKNLLLYITLISVIGLTSCEKILQEVPGNIPGMGESNKKLEIKEAFALPDGIGITGSITGIEEDDTKLLVDYKPVYGAKSSSYFGSGKLVRLTLTLVNSKDVARTVYFPKGLVWECQTDGFQHGLQIQTTWISLHPNTTRNIVIDLYCGNLGLPGPTTQTSYKILGVTSSTVLWRLLDKVGWKKVNYEMINGKYAKGEATEGPTYDQITERFQAMIHNLTDRGLDITQEDLLFINSIPELTPEEIPQIDENSQYPEYFEEFTIINN